MLESWKFSLGHDDSKMTQPLQPQDLKQYEFCFAKSPTLTWPKWQNGGISRGELLQLHLYREWDAFKEKNLHAHTLIQEWNKLDLQLPLRYLRGRPFLPQPFYLLVSLRQPPSQLLNLLVSFYHLSPQPLNLY